jgi:EAL domain-containing protein (putative c-di-GMP-specific phosphodiesterase class I)/ActR/RegA family two-component response regulator
MTGEGSIMAEVEKGRALLVEDDAAQRQAVERGLQKRGWTVETARDGLEAKEHARAHEFDVVISDVQMPGYGGMQFLRCLREQGQDVPFILMTGKPTMESTISAIEHGAFRYLLKPVAIDTLDELMVRAVRLRRLGALKRGALECSKGDNPFVAEKQALSARFDRALERLWVAYQPIVSWRDRKVVGYEALLRSDEEALANPMAFLDAAERLNRLHDIGRALRARVAGDLGQLRSDVKVFVNLHAEDLKDDMLFDPGSALVGAAHRIVLEVTERASLEGITDLGDRIRRLKEFGFRIAIDDLGAGYAGLSSFTQLDPRVVKLDMSLIRGIDVHPQKRCIVNAMRKLCEELGIMVIAEGIETAGERDALVQMGCDLFQGYLFGRPQRGFLAPTW